MLQSHMAASLPDDGVSYPLKRANDLSAGHAPRQSHAASSGINSSLT